jgi:hypothetical protein
MIVEPVNQPIVSVEIPTVKASQPEVAVGFLDKLKRIFSA